MPHLDGNIQRAIEHIRFLSETIGGRGSCTQAECQAAEYAVEQMQRLDLSAVRLESYQGAVSTYRPYALAFGAALLGTSLVWLVPGRGTMVAAALLSALGAWGMLAETDFAANWMRWLLPGADSQNAIGVISPEGEIRNRAVLCAHLDSHRTPIFYSSHAWHTLFGLLVAGAFVSMVAGAVGYGLGSLFNWIGVRWIGLAAAAMEIFALVLCLHADLTPFSPGANDDASGVGVILALAERLSRKPLASTEVWLAFTGCEEVASYGMAAFLDTHAAELGAEAVYVILDQVGLGQLMVLTSDGLIVKRKTHSHALELAQRANDALPDVNVGDQVGIAYTDAAVATKRGLIALTVDALPPEGSDSTMHWHQMSDTLEHIDPEALADAYAFTWQVLQEIDAG